jgi:sulfur-carrier protein
MSVRILFFGRLKDVTGKESIIFDSIEDIDSVRRNLSDSFPDMSNEIFAVALNQEIVNGNKQISDGDEVALLPPIAGG